MGNSGILSVGPGGHLVANGVRPPALTKKQKHALIRKRVGTVIFWLFILAMLVLLGYLVHLAMGIFGPANLAPSVSTPTFDPTIVSYL